jgi:hydroxymethylpyrimidine/phosphomethylpyrimidine kinase
MAHVTRPAGGSQQPPRTRRRPVALSIAGSDSGGGAGIQADLKTFQAFGVFGTTALTAVTAQNTRGVLGVRVLEPAFVREQIDAVCQDLRPAATKTGMLATVNIIETVADAVSDHALERVVVDPVMVATSGDLLLDPAAVDTLIDRLLPLATLVTPNLPEAELLAGLTITDEEGIRAAARRIIDRGAGAALVKGGHNRSGEVVDLLCDASGSRSWRGPRIETRHTHGTGCTLSAAITARLASGASLEAAVDAAISYTREAIASAPGLGAGHGPLNHWARFAEESNSE